MLFAAHESAAGMSSACGTTVRSTPSRCPLEQTARAGDTPQKYCSRELGPYCTHTSRTRAPSITRTGRVGHSVSGDCSLIELWYVLVKSTNSP
jgi:hypothetical protein